MKSKVSGPPKLGQSTDPMVPFHAETLSSITYTSHSVFGSLFALHAVWAVPVAKIERPGIRHLRAKNREGTNGKAQKLEARDSSLRTQAPGKVLEMARRRRIWNSDKLVSK